ncbi:hypothetical protein [Bremerella cremea]|nr:hypothetical protein [Bremerella cremea]
MMEAIVAMMIVAIAGSVLLLGVEATLESSVEQEEVVVADGIARQLLDEIQGQNWVDPELRGSPYQTSLSASADESRGPGRLYFDDTDDYNDYVSTPPVDIRGEMITSADTSGDILPDAFRPSSSKLINWRCEVEVAYVKETDHATKQPDNSPTNYRVIICRVFHQDFDNTWRQVVQRDRIISYLPAQ